MKEASIERSHAIRLLETQIARIKELKELKHSDPEIGMWHAFNEEFIKKIFGEGHRNMIRYLSLELDHSFHAETQDRNEQKNFLKALEDIEGLLNEFVRELKE